MKTQFLRIDLGKIGLPMECRIERCLAPLMSHDFKNIGRYLIEDVLGEGAMGRVFKGYDPNLERPVAIKTMRTGKIQDPEDLTEFKERFFHESKVSGRLNHPNIVSVYDSGLHGNEPFLVMEFIDGAPLDTFIRRNYAASYHHLVTILKQTAAGLDYAHEEEVVHRDIKPGNILVSKRRVNQFRAKIVDFGLARLNDSKMTQTGFFLGTPSYASPEQIINGKVDSRSDIFSLGTVAYEMLTGSLPFNADSLHAILFQVANANPNLDFSALAAYFDIEAIERVFRTVFQKDPDNRYQTALEFVAALEPLLPNIGSMDRKEMDDKKSDSQKPKSLKIEKIPEKMDDKTRLLEQTRFQFRQAYHARNLSSARYCLIELQKLAVDVSEEEGLLRTLEEELANSKDKELQIAKARSAFKLALKTRNLSSIRYCLQELKGLGAETDDESRHLDHLEKTLAAEAESREREAQRYQEIKKHRELFKEAKQAKNMNACRRELAALEKLNADVAAEQKFMDKMAKKEEEERQQRESWIKKVRVQFRHALEEKHVERCRQLITELELLLKVDAQEEKRAFKRLEKQLAREALSKANAHAIENLRQAFKESLAREDLKGCGEHVAALGELKADTSWEVKSRKELKKKIRDREAKELKESMIKHTRAHFDEALAKKNRHRCLYYLKELKQLDADVTREEKALARVENWISKQEAARLKENIIRNLREEFRKASEKENIESCRYYLRELKLNGADIGVENAIFTNLEGRDSVRNVSEAARVEFWNVFKIKDLSSCEECIKALKELGADIREEKQALRTLKAELDIADSRDFNGEGSLVDQLRFQFFQAFKSGQLRLCQKYLSELQLLDAEVESEEEAVDLLVARQQRT